MMYPDGAASLQPGSTLEPLKITIDGIAKPPAETYVRSVVFTDFSPATVCDTASPVTPTTFCSLGMSGRPVSSIFHMLNGL